MRMVKTFAGAMPSESPRANVGSSDTSVLCKFKHVVGGEVGGKLLTVFTEGCAVLEAIVCSTGKGCLQLDIEV